MPYWVCKKSSKNKVHRNLLDKCKKYICKQGWLNRQQSQRLEFKPHLGKLLWTNFCIFTFTCTFKCTFKYTLTNPLTFPFSLFPKHFYTPMQAHLNVHFNTCIHTIMHTHFCTSFQTHTFEHTFRPTLLHTPFLDKLADCWIGEG